MVLVAYAIAYSENPAGDGPLRYVDESDLVEYFLAAAILATVVAGMDEQRPGGRGFGVKDGKDGDK
jgi:hypothetical protein